MVIGSNDSYRISVEQDHEMFVRDQLKLIIVKRDPNGYTPVLLNVEVGSIVYNEYGHAYDEALPTSRIPIELAEILLNGFARQLLGTDGDLVATISRLTAERDRVTRQLENLIAGIGRLGGVGR